MDTQTIIVVVLALIAIWYINAHHESFDSNRQVYIFYDGTSVDQSYLKEVETIINSLATKYTYTVITINFKVDTIPAIFAKYAAYAQAAPINIAAIFNSDIYFYNRGAVTSPKMDQFFSSLK